MSVKFKRGQMYAIADVIASLRPEIHKEVFRAFSIAFAGDNPNYDEGRWAQTFDDAIFQREVDFPAPIPGMPPINRRKPDERVMRRLYGDKR